MSDLIKEFHKWLYYDPKTGLIWWRKKRNYKTDISKPAGRMGPFGYMYITFSGKTYLQHRLIWLVTQGHWPKYQIDHINCDASDNRLENLRDVHQSINQGNRRKNRNGRLVGTQFLKATKKWVAIITRNRKHYQLGSFNTEMEAHQCYMKEKLKFKEMCFESKPNLIESSL